LAEHFIFLCLPLSPPRPLPAYLSGNVPFEAILALLGVQLLHLAARTVLFHRDVRYVGQVEEGLSSVDSCDLQLSGPGKTGLGGFPSDALCVIMIEIISVELAVALLEFGYQEGGRAHELLVLFGTLFESE
jgi:hypothetical protein